MDLRSFFSASILLSLVVCEKLPNKEAYNNLRSTIQSVKKSCGDVCHTNDKGNPGKYFNEIHKNVNCPALFATSDIDAPSQFHDPPMRIPKWLVEDYSYGGEVSIANDYLDQSHNSELNHYNFSMYGFNRIDGQLGLGILNGPYKKSDADQIYKLMGI